MCDILKVVPVINSLPETVYYFNPVDRSFKKSKVSLVGIATNSSMQSFGVYHPVDFTYPSKFKKRFSSNTSKQSRRLLKNYCNDPSNHANLYSDDELSSTDEQSSNDELSSVDEQSSNDELSSTDEY